MSRIGKRPRIEFQLKATSQDVLKADHVAFPLPIKNYDDLRVETITARILIVLVMPENEIEWLECSQDALKSAPLRSTGTHFRESLKHPIRRR